MERKRYTSNSWLFYANCYIHQMHLDDEYVNFNALSWIWCSSKATWIWLQSQSNIGLTVYFSLFEPIHNTIDSMTSGWPTSWSCQQAVVTSFHRLITFIRTIISYRKLPLVRGLLFVNCKQPHHGNYEWYCLYSESQWRKTWVFSPSILPHFC